MLNSIVIYKLIKTSRKYYNKNYNRVYVLHFSKKVFVIIQIFFDARTNA